MHDQRTLALVFALVLIHTAALEARGACNSLPNASEVTSAGQQVITAAMSGSSSANLEPDLMSFRYKGTLGRTEGVHFVAGPMRFVADDSCVRRGTKAPVHPLIRTIGNPNDVVVFVIFDSKPGHPVPVWAYSAATHPSAMPFSLPSLAARVNHALDTPDGARLLPSTWDTGANPVALPGGIVGLELLERPPLAPNSGPPMFAGLSLASSAVRVVAMHLGRRSVEDIAIPLAHLVEHECASICERFASTGGLVCIDRVFSVINPAQAVAIYVEDPFLCTVEVPAPGGAEIAYNDFAGQCESAAATATVPPELAACANVPSTLRFWRSECGAIHFPLDYTTIRRKRLADGTSISIDRNLAGRSGVGRQLDADARRIFVPGREFLGSTPPQDVSASAPETRWRFPDVETWYPAGAESSELGLRGSVDKDKSIIHVFPRRPAFSTCVDNANVEHGCMGIGQLGVFCARDHPSTAQSACTATSGLGKNFSCQGGGRDNMPCTRDAHCARKDADEPSDGTCSRKPICRPKGTVWRYRRLEAYPGGGNTCWSDSDCQTTEQCGYSLFDFTGRVDADGLHTLDTTVVTAASATTVARKRRGACVGDETTACTNGTSSDPPLCKTNRRCRGYALSAEGEVGP
jgi:hypothetical protein